MCKKIAICVNHSYPSIGGCEIVVGNISEFFSKENYKVTIFSGTTHNPFVYNNVYYKPCFSVNALYRELQKQDIIIFYSDLFVHFGYLVNNLKNLPAKKIICTVDANFLSKKPTLLNKLKDMRDVFFVVHSENTDDYMLLKDKKIPFKVIYNGINIEEFIIKSIDFKSIYGIKEEKLFLNVSNLFPGKGQEHLPSILNNNSIDKEKYSLIFIASNNRHSFSKLIEKKIILECKKYDINYKILIDIPRDHIVSAFKQSDLFLFSSLKEAFGIVLAETQAAKTPWVSLPVGHAPSMSGGMCLDKNKLTLHKGQFVLCDSAKKEYSMLINTMLTDESIYKEKQEEGYKEAKKQFSWNNIHKQYLDIIK